MVIDLELECSLESIGRILNIDWHFCQRIQERAVNRGRQRKEHGIPAHIGVDEKSFAKGHKYETIVYDTDKGVVEDVIDHRDQQSLETYYKKFTREQLAAVETVSMDMWDPFIAATRHYVPDAADKIVFDHYHVTRVVTKAVDTVRKQEHQSLMKEGIDLLKGTRYLWLWNDENIPDFRRNEFEELRAKDLKVCRAHAIKENLRNLWRYKSKAWMEKSFDR